MWCALRRYSDATISSLALKKLQGHLWYLSEELVALAFFDDQVSVDTKRKMLRSLTNVGIENPLKRITIDDALIQAKQIEDFVSSNTRRFFEMADVSSDFLNTDPENWEDNESYISAKRTARSLRVVNDIAERGVALMDEYNKLHTNDEEQKQFLLLTVKQYRQRYPDRKKTTLAQ